MTTKYIGFTQSRGSVAPRTPVSVYTQAGVLATIYNDAGNEIANPLTSRDDGFFSFSIADGLYDLVILGDKIKAIQIGMPTSVATMVATPAVPSYTVALLPVAPTTYRLAFATDGRKNGEGGGLGTGVLVFWDGTGWIACDSGAAVAA